MSKMSEYDRTHVGEIIRKGDWFTARLFQMFQVSDPDNIERFRVGFPDEVAAWEAWLRFDPEAGG